MKDEYDYKPEAYARVNSLTNGGFGRTKTGYIGPGYNIVDPTVFKRCIKCGEIKSLVDFKKDRRRCKDGTINTCNKCSQKNQLLANRLRKEWIRSGKKIPEHCENCGIKCSVVCDHDHKTGELRGWLWQPCNRSIGGLGDNIEGLEEAILYLQGKKKSVVEYITTPLTEVMDES